MICSILRAKAGRLIRAGALTGMLLILLISACAKATPTPEPVTIRFAHLDFDEVYYSALARKFNESYPYISIELLPESWEGLYNLRAGDADVFVSQSVREQQQKGDILALDQWIESDKGFDLADFYPDTAGLFAIEGKTWAIPAWIDPEVMFYNRDLFDKYGVPYPKIGWTWEDFLDCARSIRDPEADVFGCVVPNVYDTMNFIYQHGGRLYDDWRNPTRTTYDDPLTIEALEWFAKLIHEYNVIPTSEQASKAFGGAAQMSAYYGIYQGKVGMWTGIHSDRGGQNWQQEWSFRWGMTTLPRDARSATWVRVEGLVISFQAQRPDACWRWIAFLSGQIPNRFASARKSLAESSAYEQLVGSEVAAVARASMASELLLLPTGAGSPEESRILGQALEEIISGRSTPLEAMRRAQQQLQK